MTREEAIIHLEYRKDFATSQQKEALDMAISALSESKGEWERVSAERYVVSAKYRYRCSKCGGIVIGEFNFCPNCGADMRGVSE